MNRLNIFRSPQDGLYYWSITKYGDLVSASSRGFETAAVGEQDAREQWRLFNLPFGEGGQS